MKDLITDAWAGEESLLTPEVRRDAARLDRLLADDFREIGRSGRLWTRAEIVDQLRDEAVAPTTSIFSDREALVLASGIVLLTYRVDDDRGASRRSSLWREEADALRCVFHQGTALPAVEN